MHGATEEESTTARDQSIWSACWRWAKRAAWTFFQTPCFCQADKRRQQLMPLPQPNSCGSSSQGMPVRSTNKMPLSAWRCPIGLRPGYRRRRFFGARQKWLDQRPQTVIQNRLGHACTSLCNHNLTQFPKTSLAHSVRRSNAFRPSSHRVRGSRIPILRRCGRKRAGRQTRDATSRRRHVGAIARASVRSAWRG